MPRLMILDGLRGYFLVFMLISHLGFNGGLLLVRLNHAELGFVQDMQGFVFLSGLLIGLVYAKRMQKDRFTQASVRIWKRATELYAYAMGCLFVVLLLELFLSYSWIYWGPWLGPMILGAGSFCLASAALIYQPTYMDILPQYIFYLLIAPLLVWLCITRRWASVLIGSGLIWRRRRWDCTCPSSPSSIKPWSPGSGD